MVVKIISHEKNVLELELVGIDQSLAQLLAEKLNEESDIEFAAYKLEHPMIANPKLYVRTKKGDPLKLVLSKIKELKEEIEEFKKKFTDIVS